MLGDVKVRHHLEPRRHPALNRLRRTGDVVQHAVDPESGRGEVIGRRFDVDVGGPAPAEPGEDQVDVFDDRRVLDNSMQVVSSSVVALSSAADWLATALRAALSASVFVPVHPGYVVDDLTRARDDCLHVAAEDRAEVVEGEHIRRVRHGRRWVVAAKADRQQLVAASHRLG